MIILGVVVLSAFILAVFTKGPSPATLPSAASAAAQPSNGLVEKWISCFSILFAIPVTYLFYRRKSRTHWEKENKGETHIVTIHPDGITWHNTKTHVENKWLAYSHFLETPDLFLLYLNSQLAVVLPKRPFTPAQLPLARALLQANIGKLKAFPITPNPPLPS